MFFVAGQTFTFRWVFADSVTGTPTVSVYRDSVLVAGPTNGTGSDATWVFETTIPADSIPGNFIQIYVTRTIGGNTKDELVSQEQIVTTLTEADSQIGPRFNIEFIIRDGSNNTVPSCNVVITTSDVNSSTSVTRQGYSNSYGEIEFDLTAGTYYLWRNKANYSFVDPIAFSVSSAGVVTLL